MLNRFEELKSEEKEPFVFSTRERASTLFPEVSLALIREMALLGSFGRAVIEIMEFVSLRFKSDGPEAEMTEDD